MLAKRRILAVAVASADFFGFSQRFGLRTVQRLGGLTGLGANLSGLFEVSQALVVGPRVPVCAFPLGPVSRSLALSAQLGVPGVDFPLGPPTAVVELTVRPATPLPDFVSPQADQLFARFHGVLRVDLSVQHREWRKCS